MKIAVLIPTYNEAGNIGSLLDEIKLVCGRAPEHEWTIVVIDGNSTDQTCKIVQEKHYPRLAIHLLREKEKGGIAQAYLTGITYAVNKLKADAFAEFDGDGQHNPADLLVMAEKLTQGADYVIGSRYIKGGSIPAKWALHRKLLSRFGSLYARLLLELPVHDVTSGLRMTRIQNFAVQLPTSPQQLLTSDYAYKIHFLTLMLQARARVVEIPIVFRERLNDTSKSTARDIFESLRVVTLLRLQHLKNWRLLRVLAVGGIGFLIQTTLFELLSIRSSLLSPSSAAVLGGEFAILSNFLLNERFSFHDRRSKAISPILRLVKFHLVSAGSIFIQWSFLATAEQLTADPTALRLVYLLGIGIGFLANYAGYYFFVWRFNSQSNAPQPYLAKSEKTVS